MTIIKNLVFEGGGIKGLAYAGALEALAGRGHLQTVEQVAGTSAGAITALLVALGYDLEAINKELNRDFKGFTDGSRFKTVKMIHFLQTFGMHPGKEFEHWIQWLVERRLGKKMATFADLHKAVVKQGESVEAYRYRDVHVVGTDLSVQGQAIFSYHTTPHLSLAEAVRISMAIPIFFEPRFYSELSNGEWRQDPAQGHLYVDGGLVNNYPIELFDAKGLNPETLGLRVDSPAEIGQLRDGASPVGKAIRPWQVSGFKDYGESLVETARLIQNQKMGMNNFRTIYIDIGEIKTTEFALTEEQKERLVTAGRDATAQYFATVFDRPVAQLPGHDAMKDQVRHEKHDRAQWYQKASGVYAHQPSGGQGLIQWIFSLPEGMSHWVLQRKIGRYANRCQQQRGVHRVLFGQAVKEDPYRYVLQATVDGRLIEEYRHWHEKQGHRFDHEQLQQPINEEALIPLKTYQASLKPRWMQGNRRPQIEQQAFLEAVSMNNLDVVQTALLAGMTLYVRDARKGTTPWHYGAEIAATTGDRRMLRLLLDHTEGPLTHTNHYGDTVLHVLAEYPQGAEISSHVLLHGAPVNKANRQGETALMIAAKLGNVEGVKVLLAHHGDANMTDQRGYTALSKARHFRQQAMEHHQAEDVARYDEVIAQLAPLAEEAVPGPAPGV